MKRIEDLLKEVKIRFGENWEDAEIDIISYPFDEISFCIGGNSPAISHDEVWSNNGLLYRVEIDGKEKWSTAKITKKTEKWVVEKDEDHPVWKKFKEWIGEAPSYEDCDYVGQSIFGQNTFADNILYYEGYQYLTLDQWAEFFLPKVDFSIHNEEEWFYVRQHNIEFLVKGSLNKSNSIAFALRSKSIYPNGVFTDDLDGIAELRKPTEEEMNVLYQYHPEYAPPKEGDYGLFWDHNTPFKWIGCFDRMNKDESKYLDDSSRLWNHFKPFSPELQEMIKKEIDNI